VKDGALVKHEPSTTGAISPDALRLLSQMPVGVMHCTFERIDFANEAMQQILQESEASLLGRSFLEFVAPEDFEVVEGRYWSRQRGDRAVPMTYELSIRRRDGTRTRVEIEPRSLGERELLVVVRDLGPRLRDSALLGALSEVALWVQRARTVPEVLREAGAGLRGLGLQMAAIRVQGTTARVLHVDLASDVEETLERLVGRSLTGTLLQMEHLGLGPRALRERRSLFSDSLHEVALAVGMRMGIHRPGAPELQALERGGLGQGVFCPLFVHGDAWGFLVIASGTLGSGDAAAIGLFAAQVSSALEIAETIHDLERKNRELAAIHNVATTGSEADLDRLLPTLMRLVSAATASDAVGLYLLEPERGELVLASEYGTGGQLACNYPVVALGEGVTGAVALAGQPRGIHVETDMPPEVADVFLSEGFRELAIVPLRIKDRLGGTLNLGRKGEHPYSRAELRFAELLSQQVAIQVESARLYADVQRRVRQLSALYDVSRIGAEALEVAPLIALVLEAVTRSVPVDGVAIHLVEVDRLVLAGGYPRGDEQWTHLASAPFDEGTLCGAVALRRCPLVVGPDQWPPASKPLASRLGIRHGVGIPLLAKDRLIGTFSVTRCSDVAFDAEELRLLESCAAQVAVAIEHARLFEEERRRVEELRLLVEVGRVITGSLNAFDILEAIAAPMAQMAEAQKAFVYLLDKEKDALHGVAASCAADREHFLTVRLPLDAPSSAVLAVLSRSPVRISDCATAVQHQHALAERYGQRSMLALPLLVRDEPIGAAVITDAVVRTWTDAQVERATVVARQIAIAVANAQLYDDLRQSYEKLARAQQELVKRERLVALGELAAVVAHEVRNPLGVIFNSLGSLRRSLPDGNATMLLDIVGEEADRLNRIVSDLLDFARPSEVSLEPEPIAGGIAGAVDAAVAQAAMHGVRIEVEVDGWLPAVPVDGRMLRQALLNLVINGVQATPKGGMVKVAAHQETADGRPLLRVEVSDTGPGIAPDLAERIFEPVFTTKAAGTGLGLAVVRRIVDAHHGEVSLAATKPGAGACFVIRLPVEVGRTE